MVKFKSTHESNYDIYFKLWQFGWSLCRDLKILEWWTWVTFLFLEEFVSLELFIFHQTTRFPKEMEELSKKALLWQLQDFIMTSSCLKGIFCFQWLLKHTLIFWGFLLKSKTIEIFSFAKRKTRFQLSLDQNSMFLHGNNLQVKSHRVVLSSIRRIYTFFNTNGAWRWLPPLELSWPLDSTRVFFFEREPSQMANSIFFSLPIHLG